MGFAPRKFPEWDPGILEFLLRAPFVACTLNKSTVLIKTGISYFKFIVLSIIVCCLYSIFTMPLSALAEEFLRVLLAHEDGVPDDRIKTIFGDRYEELPRALNELLAINRVQLFTNNGSLVYKAIKEETAAKFEGLG